MIKGYMAQGQPQGHDICRWAPVKVKLHVFMIKRPLVAELKLKMSQLEQFVMISISAVPPEGAFHMVTNF